MMRNGNTDSPRDTDADADHAAELYDDAAVRRAASNAAWTTTLPAATSSSADAARGDDGGGDGGGVAPASWRVIAAGEHPDSGGEQWQLRRVPTAASAPDLYAATVTRSADADADHAAEPGGVGVAAVGRVELVPRSHDDRLFDMFDAMGADTPAGGVQRAVRAAYQRRAVDVFWQRAGGDVDGVEFVAGETRADAAVVMREPGDIRDVFDLDLGAQGDADENGELSDRQLDALVQGHAAARPKRPDVLRGALPDYVLDVSFGAVPVFELRAVAAAGQDAAAAVREAARRDVLVEAGVPVDAARRATVGE